MQLRKKDSNDVTASLNDEIVHLTNLHKTALEITAESQEVPIDLWYEGLLLRVCIVTIPFTAAEGNEHSVNKELPSCDHGARPPENVCFTFH